MYGPNLERRILDKILHEIFELLVKRNFASFLKFWDRLCGLVIRVLGYRSGGSGSIPGTTRKKK
jgi:hypothetical protein